MPNSPGLYPLHHTDPFDRMLIAQAQLDTLIIVTRDRASLLMASRYWQRKSGFAG
jgi:Uncharacterized protein conserved in bacteria